MTNRKDSNQRLFVLAGGAAWESAVLAHIDASPRLSLVRRCIDVADLLASSKTDHAHAVVLDPTLPGFDAGVADRLEGEGLALVSVGAAAPGLGVVSNIELGEIHALGDLLATIAVTADPASPLTVDEGPDFNENLGQVTAVWGPVGAPGRSTLALSLAASHAKAGERTLLVDADVRGAAVAQMLAVLDDVSGVLASSRDVNLGRSRDMSEHALRVKPSLDVLTGIPRPDVWHHVRPAALVRVLDQARARYDHVVVDCGWDLESDDPISAARGDITQAVIEFADLTLGVGKPDPISITRLLRSVGEVSVIATRLELVLNQIRPSTPWAEGQISDMIFEVSGQRPMAFIPFDAEACDRALLTGEPAIGGGRGTAFESALERLADMIRSTLAPVTSSHT
ncbi:MAG: tyrosine-protein kinase family protein [Aeromicrobium sp.]|nr:MAG: tyrosine-protein kinase family protein [Aeromicrobium sp.]